MIKTQEKHVFSIRNADVAVIANHGSHRQSHSIKKGWIIGLDSPDFPITAQLYLATGLWPSQSQRLAVAKNHSLHPKSGRTSSDPNFSTGVPSVMNDKFVALIVSHGLVGFILRTT